MAATFFGFTSTPADNGSQAGPGPLAIPPVASMQQGHLCVVDVEYRDGVGTIGLVAAGGQSWTEEAQVTSGNMKTRRYWCTFNGTWTADPSWEVPGGFATALSLLMTVFQPTATNYTWQSDVAQSSGTGSKASDPEDVTITGITTLTDGAVVLAEWAILWDTDTWALQTGGWANPGGVAQVRNLYTNGCSGSLAYKIQATAGATGNVANRATGGNGAFTTKIQAWKEVAPPATGAFTFVAHGSVPADNGSNATNPTVIPASALAAAQQGDLVVFVPNWRGGTGTPGTYPRVLQAAGQAWTGEAILARSNLNTRLAWCQFNGTWSADPSVEFGDPWVNTVEWVIFRPDDPANTVIRDVAQAGQADVTPDGSNDVTATGLTTVTANALVLAYFASLDDNAWALQTGGWSNPGGAAQVRNAVNQQNSISLAYKTQVTPGATGNVANRQTANGPDASNWAIIAFAQVPPSTVVRPPSGAKVVTVGGSNIGTPWVGWGGTAWMAHEPWSADFATWATWGPLARALLVNDLGLTDIRINLAAGVESDADYYLTAWNAGGPESIWNQQAWAGKDTETFYFTSVSKVVDLIVNPLRALIQGNGEVPYVTLHAHGGGNWGNSAFYDSTADDIGNGKNGRQKMANRVLEAFKFLWNTYGWIPDAVSPVNEPDTMSTEWTTAEFADLVYRIGTTLEANKASFGQGAGWHPTIGLPDVAYQQSGFATWFDAAWNHLPGSGYPNRTWIVAGAYHLYDGNRPNWDFTTLVNRLDTAALPGWMLEYTGLTAHLLHTVLKGVPRTVRLHRFSLKDWFDVTGGGTAVAFTGHAKLVRNYARYIRPGAQRKSVSHNSEAVAAGYDGIPWVNPNGRTAVVVRTPAASGDIWIDGLPAGVYGVNYGLGTDTDQTSNTNSTTVSVFDQDLADVVLTAGSALKVSTTGVGAYTVYQKSPANTPPPAPALTAPNNGVTVNNSVQLTWTQAVDADGDPLTHYREHRASGAGSWIRSSAVFSGHVWDTSGLSNGNYEWRIVASDGAAETPSSTRAITISHSNTAPPAPAWVTPASDGLTFNSSVLLTWGAVADPDGDPVQVRGEYKPAAGSTWLPIFSLQSPLSFGWNTAGLADGDYHVRLFANDGQADSTASVVRTVTITHPVTGATSGMTINGFDPIAYGVVLESLEGVGGPPSHQLEEQQIAGVPGTTVIDRRVLARTVALNYAIVGTDETDVRAKNDLFTALVTEQQPVELVLLRRSTRKLVLEYLDDVVNSIGPYLGTGQPAGAWRGRLSLTAPQPYWQETTESSVTGITTTPVALAQGNGPTWIRFKLQGPATNPRVDLYAWDGTLVASMQFSGSLASGEWYTVDCELKTAYRNTTGLFTSGTDILGGELATPNFFQILRRHSRTRTNEYVKIACAAGTLQVFWYKRWGSN